MANSVKYTYGMADKDIAAGIISVGKRHKTLYKDIQHLAVSIIHGFHKSNDTETVTRRANDLIAALAGGKQNALRRWFETFAPLVYNKETKLLVVGFNASSPVKDYRKIDAMKARDELWYNAIPDPEYKPLADLNGQIAQLVKRAKTDIERLGDQSKVNRQQLVALESLLSKAA